MRELRKVNDGRVIRSQMKMPAQIRTASIAHTKTHLMRNLHLFFTDMVSYAKVFVLPDVQKLLRVCIKIN